MFFWFQLAIRDKQRESLKIIASVYLILVSGRSLEKKKEFLAIETLHSEKVNSKLL